MHVATRDYNVYSRLMVNGNEIPISSFRVDFPQGTLGSSISCELADPTQVVPDTGEASFEIGVDSGTGVEWVPVMETGKLNSKKGTVGWLRDLINITAISPLAERWDRCPVRPIIIYDPNQVSVVLTSSSSLGDLVDENHNFILPELVSITGLDLLKALNFIYVERLGFSSVITNIPNFLINRLDVSVSSSFHSVIAAEIGIFEPVYHSSDSGVLWIIDPQGSLPAELPIKKLKLKHYAAFDRSEQLGRLVNAVILSYRDNISPGGGNPTNRAEQEIQQVGTFGTPGWQRTEVTRFITDFHDNPVVPSEVTRSVVTRVRNIVSAKADGLVRTVAIDDQQDQYLYDYHLKAGYVKEVSLYCRLPGHSASMRLVQREVNQIIWDQLTSRPGEFIKRFELTEVSGLVLKTQDDLDDDTTIRRESLYNANRLNEIPEDEADAEVETDRAISSQIDVFRVVGPDQIEVATQKINHLNSQASADQTRTAQHTGTIQVRAGNQSITINMLIVNHNFTDSERRVPAHLNAGNVPFVVARQLAQRILDRKGQSPTSANLELAGIDLALRRGSLRNVHDREDNIRTVFITGFTIVGDQLGTSNFRVTMTATGVEIDG